MVAACAHGTAKYLDPRPGRRPIQFYANGEVDDRCTRYVKVGQPSLGDHVGRCHDTCLRPVRRDRIDRCCHRRPGRSASLTQVRSATLRIDYGDVRFLVDPVLADKDTYPGFEGTANSQRRNERIPGRHRAESGSPSGCEGAAIGISGARYQAGAVVFSRAASSSLASGAAEAGFCPVMRRPSTTTCASQFPADEYWAPSARSASSSS